MCGIAVSINHSIAASKIHSIKNSLLIVILFFQACTGSYIGPVFQFGGPAQGTSYSITYYGDNLQNHQAAIDSILAVIDLSLSTYDTNSTVSRFNRQDSLQTSDPHFRIMLEKSRIIYEQTDGAFDPTVMPLVKAWGFGPDNSLAPKIAKLDSLKQLVGFQKLHIVRDPDVEDQISVFKEVPGLQLDFNAIAQGYTVDLIARFLDKKKVRNYLIELGGEVKVRGKKPEGQPWSVGVEKPDDIIGLQELAAIIPLKNSSLATSGSYNKYYLKDGVKYSHTIDPFSGAPVRHSMLSVTVRTRECAVADAFATAFMVWGLEKSQVFLAAHPELELDAYFIYSSASGALKSYVTKGMAIERVEW